MMAPTLMERLREDRQLRGLAARTQASYGDAVTGLAKFCGRSADALAALTEEELRQSLLHLVAERHAARSTVAVR